MTNIAYKSKKFSERYNSYRISWQDLYDSEKAVLEQLPFNSDDSILDLGCACGGLGIALKEKFNVEKYIGIDINLPAITQGNIINPSATLFHGDILDVQFNTLGTFDKVISLSCIDWNIEYELMLDRSWEFVKPGGYLIVSIKLTDQSSICDINTSYQYIDNTEKAQYTVINIKDFIDRINRFNVAEVIANGYWGDIKPNTISPYSKVCFSVFAIKKADNQYLKKLDLPDDILRCL